MLKIGLTGGIGCGKSTVARIFEQLKTPVIDADEIAHQLVTIGQPALAQIQQDFGIRVFKPDGSLDRKKLSEIVFSDPKQKLKLESIIHPLVYQFIQACAVLHYLYPAIIRNQYDRFCRPDTGCRLFC